MSFSQMRNNLELRRFVLKTFSFFFCFYFALFCFCFMYSLQINYGMWLKIKQSLVNSEGGALPQESASNV